MIDGILYPETHPRTLIELADTAAPLLAPWAAGYFVKGQPLANIVIVDHFEATPVVAVAMNSSQFVFPVITK